MVFIDGVKYACATCIKGHRSTACQHSDRELFAIKRKGRPITQCSHCRELRRTQKVHVKCNCNEKKKEESISPQTRVLPQADNRSTETDDQSLNDHDEYQPTLGDKTSVESLLNPCRCLTGAKCICCRSVTEQDSSDMQYSNHNHSHFNREFATSNTMNIPFTNNVYNCESSYLFPPIPNLNYSYDNTKLNLQYPFMPSWNHNDGGYSSCSGKVNHPVAQKNTRPFTNNMYNMPLERRHSCSNIDDMELTSLDQSRVLGEKICHSTSADLANMIYGPFQSCSSAMTDGGCCGSNKTAVKPVCRCGPGCKCEGCDTRVRIINVDNNEIPSSNCCSSYHEVTKPEHKKVRDEDGVYLCGCGCQKLDTECSDCLKSLCEEYLLK